MKVVFVIASVAVLAVRPAHADQCEWLDDPSTARRAARELAAHPEIVELCEPCGDAAPGAPRRASNVSVRSVDDHHELAIDGRTVDLAYIYVKISGGLYRNLAMLAGCPTSGVSPRLRVDPATSTGVLIHADHGALPSAMPASSPPASPPAAAPEAAAQRIIFMESPLESSRRWLDYVALLAMLGALGAWGMARRRPRHVPRAANLEREPPDHVTARPPDRLTE